MIKAHLRHTKKCLQIKILSDDDLVKSAKCTKTKTNVSYQVYGVKVNPLQYKRWQKNKCVECGKQIDRRFISTLTCAECESQKIHVKFW